MASTFWGLKMEPGKRYSTTVDKSFHVSMATLDTHTVNSDNEVVSVVLEESGGGVFFLTNLRKKDHLFSHLDLNFITGDKITLFCKGQGVVHLSGYMIQDDDELSTTMLDDEADDEEMDEEVEDEDIDDSLINSIQAKNKKASAKRKQENEKNKKAKKKKLEIIGKSDEDTEEDSDEDGDEEDDDDDEDDENGLMAGLEDQDSDDDVDDEEDDDDDEEDEDDDDEEEKVVSKKQKNKQKNQQALQLQQQQQQQQQQKSKKQKNASPNKTPNGTVSPQQKGKKGEGKKVMEVKPQQNQQGGKTGQESTLTGGVKVKDLKAGSGQICKSGKHAVVYYTGRLKSNGKVFDSVLSGSGFKFKVGQGEVIKGWDIGVDGMRVGGKRIITCPPQVAYGQKGAPPQIPPNSTLVFEVELKNVN